MKFVDWAIYEDDDETILIEKIPAYLTSEGNTVNVRVPNAVTSIPLYDHTTGVKLADITTKNGQGSYELTEPVNGSYTLRAGAPTACGFNVATVSFRLGSEDAELKAVQNAKIAELNDACNKAILEGFTSEALGEPHQYAFDYDAQINMLGISMEFATGAITEVEWATEDAGALVHNASQWGVLMGDAKKFKWAMVNQYRSLKADALACRQENDVEAITWVSP